MIAWIRTLRVVGKVLLLELICDVVACPGGFETLRLQDEAQSGGLSCCTKILNTLSQRCRETLSMAIESVNDAVI